MSIEESRQYHEESERIIDCFTKELQFEGRNHKEKINSEHRQYELLTRYLEITERLKDYFEDKSGIREREIKKMSSPNEFTEFYARLTEIKEYHRRNPEEGVTMLSLEYDRYPKVRDNPDEAGASVVEFTDEEGYGKFLDLHECYQLYRNIKTIPAVDYVTYLSSFDKLYEYPRDRKTAAYATYLQRLWQYLEDFVTRAKPMLQFTESEARRDLEQRFERDWEEGRCRGWTREATSAIATGQQMPVGGAHLDLSTFNSPKELESVGLDRLKSALVALGMKCGGTLEERADRLWRTKGKSLEELRVSMKASFKKGGRAAAASSVGGAGAVASGRDEHRRLARLESQVAYVMEHVLAAERAETIENVQRKQARSLDELEEEEDSEEEPDALNGGGDGAGADNDESTAIYNPKNLPLDWDGKPIPYWLYKLHGLNMYYTCEICGNETYRGPKAFQQHFTEWRHAHGMRCLGVPNTAAFANITKIADAIALWAKLNRGRAGLHHRQEEEEYEDSAGNVVSKRTYDDLKRQGLL